jgi:hypothetical protein
MPPNTPWIRPLRPLPIRMVPAMEENLSISSLFCASGSGDSLSRKAVSRWYSINRKLMQTIRMPKSKKNRMMSVAQVDTWREANRPAVVSSRVISSGILATSKLMPKSASSSPVRWISVLFCRVCCKSAKISVRLPSWITAGISAEMDLMQYINGKKTHRVIRVQVRAAATQGLVLELRRL